MARILLVLGRPDAPTDALEDYAQALAHARRAAGDVVAVARLRWDEVGWRVATERLLVDQADMLGAGSWAWFQYSALQWSRRGVPFRLPGVLRRLRLVGGRVGVTFHDRDGFPGLRLRDVARRGWQRRVMAQLAAHSDATVLTVPATAPWSRAAPVCVHVGVGSTLPPSVREQTAAGAAALPPLLTVFGVTGGAAGQAEAALLAAALRQAAKAGPLRLHVFGRGAGEHGAAIAAGLGDAPVTLNWSGVLAPDQAAAALAASDLHVFLRPPLEPNRSSAMVALAAGLPLVATHAGPLAPALAAAGIVTVPPDDATALAGAIAALLADPGRRRELAQRSRAAYVRYFDWPVIARAYGDAEQQADDATAAGGPPLAAATMST